MLILVGCVEIMWYFYVLQSEKNKNWFYKGSTGDLKERVRQHQKGIVEATKPYLPVRLVYYEAYISEKSARLRESKVKKSGSVSKPLIDRIKKSL